jgi:hypothetical protein
LTLLLSSRRLALFDSNCRRVLQSLEFYTSFSCLVNSRPFFFPCRARFAVSLGLLDRARDYST